MFIYQEAAATENNPSSGNLNILDEKKEKQRKKSIKKHKAQTKNSASDIIFPIHSACKGKHFANC